ncbi:MAG: histidine kinase, partial [Prolixibacteraceae bacterium]|nr:histidine kinase [Prolixibacteraceae bacterium]
DYYGIINTHCSIAEIHEKLKEYNKAIAHFEKARDLALEQGLSNEIRKSYEGLYRLNRKVGNYHTALTYHEKYTALSDSLSGAAHKKAVAEIETKYETEKKEQQIEKLTAEKEIEALKARQRSLIAVIMASLLLFIALAAYLIIHQKNLQNVKRESELNQKLLRSQMNPHFVFNALGNIQNYIYNNKSDDAAKYLAKFAKLMRNILESSINEFIPIEQEIETVTNYLTLQQIRSNNDFRFEVMTDGDFQGEEIPPMLAQPFIENAVKHAFNPSITDAMIKVRYIFNDESTCIVIEDNGIGINSAEKKRDEGHKSHAIELTCERLSLFNRKKRKLNLVEIKDLSETGGRGTKVEICFKQS